MSIEYKNLDRPDYTLVHAKEEGSWEVINIIAPGATGAALLLGQLRQSPPGGRFTNELQLYPYGFQDYYYTLIDLRDFHNKTVQEKLEIVADLIDNRETKMTKVPYEKWKEVKEIMPHKSFGNDRAKEPAT